MKIEKNVPISPVERRHGGARTPNLVVRTFRKMVPGDSVFVPAVHKKRRDIVRQYAYKEFGSGNYTVRQREEGGKLGLRVWKTA